MGAFFNNGEQYGGTATTASQVMYNTTESVADKIDELEGKTGSDIPVSTGETETIAEAIGNLTTPVISSVTWNDTNVTGDPQRKSVITLGKLVVFSIEFTPLNGKIVHNNIIATGLPIPNNATGSAAGRFVYSDRGRQFAIDGSGNLLWYFPTVTNDYSRIDITGIYIK
jgi:hypothetical protein